MGRKVCALLPNAQETPALQGPSASLPVCFACCQSQAKGFYSRNIECLGNYFSHKVDAIYIYIYIGGLHKGQKIITFPTCILPEDSAEPAPGLQGAVAWCDSSAKAA